MRKYALLLGAWGKREVFPLLLSLGPNQLNNRISDLHFCAIQVRVTIDLDSSCRPTSQMSNSAEEEDFADIRAYFSTTKWNRLCMAEKKRFMQIKENHLVLASLGLSFVAPAFMRREKPGQVRVCSPEETDSEEVQLWTSGLTGARVWKPPTVRQGSLQQPIHPGLHCTEFDG
ncbi:unnamed protein product [Boreogadus saida]